MGDKNMITEHQVGRERSALFDAEALLYRLKWEDLRVLYRIKACDLPTFQRLVTIVMKDRIEAVMVGKYDK